MTGSTRRTALVTGASSGIGSAYARLLALRDYDLVLVARRQDRLEALASEIGNAHGVSVRPLPADLSTEAGCVQVEAFIEQASRIDLLVNNAGIGVLGPFIDQDPAQVAKLIALNITALTRLSHTALRHFRRVGAGTLINVASIGALRAMKNGAAYGASKAYVLNLSRSLQLECADLPVRIQAVMPGPVRTELFTAAGADESIFPAESFLSADDLVTAAMKGLDAGEAVTFPTLADAAQWDEVARPQTELRESAGRLGIVAPRYRD